MKIIKYSHDIKSKWNDFISVSKNGHFMFYRDYLEYHADRFLDYSLIVENEKGKIIALLPANIENNIVHSHQGLTFGGLIVDDSMKTDIILSVFELLIQYLKEQNISKMVYKCIPYIYHIKPSEEDRYALFRCNAKLVRRDVTSTIDLTQQIRYSKGRKWTINKAKKTNLEICESVDYDVFWKMLNNVLEEQHDVHAVHSVEEIKKLSDSFPKNIKLFLAKMNGEILSGAVIYENNNIVHTQYLANSDLGREVGALDYLIDYLIKEKYKNKKYFDFGISNENSGKYLNSGLIAQKEGFGARPVVHDFYELDLT